MKPTTNSLSILAGVFALGLIGMGFLRVMAQSDGDKNPPLQVAKAATRSTPTPIGDLELIPIYPNGRVVTTQLESIRWNQITYEIPEDLTTAEEFYKSALLDRGWKFSIESNHLRRYFWTDPSGLSAWHLFADVLAAPIDEKVTQVVLTFGRYPDVRQNLPVLPDAQEVRTTTTHSEQKTEDRSEQVDVTIKTFTSKSSPEEVKGFYVSEMEQFGWILPEGWSPPIGPGVETSDGGLHLIARPVGETMLMMVGIDLIIHISPMSNGQSLVTLQATETRLVGGW